jgi:hypothetical protein
MLEVDDVHLHDDMMWLSCGNFQNKKENENDLCRYCAAQNQSHYISNPYSAQQRAKACLALILNNLLQIFNVALYGVPN